MELTRDSVEYHADPALVASVEPAVAVGSGEGSNR